MSGMWATELGQWSLFSCPHGYEFGYDTTTGATLWNTTADYHPSNDLHFACVAKCFPPSTMSPYYGKCQCVLVLQKLVSLNSVCVSDSAQILVLTVSATC